MNEIHDKYQQSKAVEKRKRINVLGGIELLPSRRRRRSFEYFDNIDNRKCESKKSCSCVQFIH